MLRIYQQKLSNTIGCTRGVSRRNFLQFGSGLAGLTLADILRADAGALSGHKKKSVIVFWTHGGMSQQDTYDMKPDAPSEYRGMYLPVQTNVAGINISERFPLQAKVMLSLIHI